MILNSILKGTEIITQHPQNVSKVFQTPDLGDDFQLNDTLINARILQQ